MGRPASRMVLLGTLLQVATCVATPSSREALPLLQVTPCPKATSSDTFWPRYENADYGISLSAPWSYRRINFNSGSDTTVAFPFSLWKNAVTRVEFFSPRSFEAEGLRTSVGRSCDLRTEIGDLRMVTWRSIGKLYDGRDTTNFNARGEIRYAGKLIAVIHLSSLDSLSLLDNLQILQTIRRLKSVR